ncbi:hypothetical protein MTO96_036611 [Rhipicephalus appendiculatus]
MLTTCVSPTRSTRKLEEVWITYCRKGEVLFCEFLDCDYMCTCTPPPRYQNRPNFTNNQINNNEIPE